MIKKILNPLPSPFHLYGGDFSQIFSEYDRPTSKLHFVQKYIATGRLDKVLVDYVTPNPEWISSLLL